MILILSSRRHTDENSWGEQIGLEELKELIQSYMSKKGGWFGGELKKRSKYYQNTLYKFHKGLIKN